MGCDIHFVVEEKTDDRFGWVGIFDVMEYLNRVVDYPPDSINNHRVCFWFDN